MLHLHNSTTSALSEDRETRIQTLLDQLRPAADQALRHMVEQLVDAPEQQLFGDLELPSATRPTNSLPLSTKPASTAGKRGYRGSSSSCPHCLSPARFLYYLSRSLLTVNGPLTVSRAYYHCEHCHHGHCPWDHILGLGDDRLSAATRPLVALAGTLAPFQQGEEVLRRLAGLQVSASTCRRVTETAGDRLRQQYAAGVVVLPGRPAAWDFSLPPRDGQAFPGTVAYLGLDAFAVATRPVKGRGVEWRMLYVGLLYDPRKQHTVYVTAYDFEVVAARLRSYAVAFGLANAAVLVAITDGGNGLERVLRQNVSDGLQFVLDYWHEAERLHKLATLLHPTDRAAAVAWAEQAKSLLWQAGGVALWQHLQALSLPAEASKELQDELRRRLAYYQENGHRTDYAGYRAQGWDVGSGPTEAGCKVLQGRLKGAGMRWQVSGSEQVAALKALYATGEGLWDAFWAQPQRPAA